MEHNRLELIQTIEEQKAEHQRDIAEVKLEAENGLAMVRSNLETQLTNQKVQNEATDKERRASMANMNSDYKRFMADMIRQQVELETVSSQRWQDKTNQITLIDLRLSKLNTKMEESNTLFFQLTYRIESIEPVSNISYKSSRVLK